MANQDKESINARIKREMDKETKGMSPKEKEEYIRNFFAQMKTTKKTMTANKGGMAKAANKRKKNAYEGVSTDPDDIRKRREEEMKKLKAKGKKTTTKKMRGGGMAKGKAKMAKKKMRGGGMTKRMRGGGMMKKKMMGGGMAKMSKRKKMMGGGMAKMAKKKKR